MLRFDKATYLSLLFKFIFSVISVIFSVYENRLSDSLWGSDVLLFLEFLNIVFIFVLYLYWIYYIAFLVISLAWYQEYMICLI